MGFLKKIFRKEKKNEDFIRIKFLVTIKQKYYKELERDLGKYANELSWGFEGNFVNGGDESDITVHIGPKPKKLYGPNQISPAVWFENKKKINKFYEILKEWYKQHNFFSDNDLKYLTQDEETYQIEIRPLKENIEYDFYRRFWFFNIKLKYNKKKEVTTDKTGRSLFALHYSYNLIDRIILEQENKKLAINLFGQTVEQELKDNDELNKLFGFKK